MSKNDRLMWSDEYRIGHKMIDMEHQFLFSLFQELDDLVSSGNVEKDRMIGAIQRLLDYSRIHFRSEEEIMFLNQYEYYESHCREHRKFIEDVEGLREFVEHGWPANLSEAILLVKRGFIQHFHNEDADLAKIAS